MYLQKLKELVLNKYMALTGATLAAAQSAYAALPSGIEAAINSVGADLETAATAILTAMLGFWALRKLGSKMGWW